MLDTIIIGNKVLIKPINKETKLNSGIIIPGTAEKEAAEGHVVNVGPGYPIPDFKSVSDDDAFLQRISQEKHNHYIPLQVNPGDTAIYMTKHAIDVKLDSIDYVIVPQDAILLVRREI
jgi:chaperonin GroES